MNDKRSNFDSTSSVTSSSQPISPSDGPGLVAEDPQNAPYITDLEVGQYKEQDRFLPVSCSLSPFLCFTITLTITLRMCSCGTPDCKRFEDHEGCCATNG